MKKSRRRRSADDHEPEHTAPANDTSALDSSAPGQIAERVASGARSATGDGPSPEVEEKTTLGITLARLKETEQAMRAFSNAAATAEREGDREGAGIALVTLLEETSEQLGLKEYARHYEAADRLLRDTEELAHLGRLRASARALCLKAQAPMQLDLDDMRAYGGTFYKVIARVEKQLLRLALIEAKGKVSHAAKLLGFRNHESVTSRLKTKHRDLLDLKEPTIPRRRSITKPEARQPVKGSAD